MERGGRREEGKEKKEGRREGGKKGEKKGGKEEKEEEGNKSVLPSSASTCSVAGLLFPWVQLSSKFVGWLVSS